ncbi:MAG: UDP-N-acetylmuramoyl-tripeptide--D-alanyl-D-alanine ligase [Porticoccaceae bacterium]|nr:UDP-N-acetylmuramoyl-tripeptide--D-alanyl-D-alanine ligase [Pseudomonadales bacterium]MCP5172588.1 UDP-N-acetylmuramoyl-tripeptide--D-alanyl-D-alanine ligase [Pseudomonadales bacterium]MCP5303504.1 UDP-N-acetylmuramoyl-tripeptide--D-alanyl-D-alanine ligase [Pseudomonadales bacterium]
MPNGHVPRTPLQTVKAIYQRVKRSGGVSTSLSSLEEGDVFFALPVYCPESRLKRMVWAVWGTFELYSPSLLKRLCVFFAFGSDRFSRLADQPLNGNVMAPAAIEKGASVAVVDSYRFRGPEYIYTPNVEHAFLNTATYHRNQHDIECIAITGSCGKTTTKELIAAVAACKLETSSTHGNYNTIRGVAHTLFDIDSQTQVAVVEISSTGKNTIALKSEVVNPTAGVITNIGKAHLEGFGSVGGVLREKSRLFNFLQAKGGVFFANLDDPHIESLPGIDECFWSYGENAMARIRGCVLECGPFVRVRCSTVDFGDPLDEDQSFDVQTQMFGAYNLSNVLAAVAVGRYLGIDNESIKAAIEGYVPSNNRSQVVRRDGATYIVDAYNANPTSMHAALDSFARIHGEKKVVILGDMLELGGSSQKEHRDVVRKLGQMDLTFVALVGAEFSKCASGRGYLLFSSSEEVRSWMSTQDFDGSSVLIKGSNSMGLELLL